MLGLMVHTVSDGIALGERSFIILTAVNSLTHSPTPSRTQGAAAFAGSSEATMLIFLAIILHKGTTLRVACGSTLTHLAPLIQPQQPLA